jgi:transcriptional regulator with XRE-family HTH domain
MTQEQRMSPDASFGRWLQRRRKALGLTQAELGAHVGASAAAIRKIEADERRPSADIASRLGQHFAIPADQQTAFVRFARGESSGAG